MKTAKTYQILMFAMTLAVPCLSSASTLNITFGGNSAGNEGVVSSVAGASTINFDNGALPSNYSVSGNGGVITGSQSGVYLEPTNDTSAFLTSGTGTVTIAPTSPASYFGLYWGSLDAYNTINFGFANGSSASYTGAQIASMDNIPSNGTTSAYVNFSSSTPITSISLVSSNYAFESDNHAFVAASATPEPSTWLLTASGLGLAALFLRRRQKQVRA